MKKIIVTVTLIMGYLSSVYAQAPYIKGEIGAVGLGSYAGTSAGFRFGVERKGWDASFGYDRIMGNLDSDKVEANGLTIHAVGIELYNTLISIRNASFRVGTGVGYGIVELEGRDKAENDVYFTPGAEVRYILSDNFMVGVHVKGFFMRTHTHRTDYGSHIETLMADGVPSGQVEVLDEYPKSESLNLSSGQVGLSLTYRF